MIYRRAALGCAPGRRKTMNILRVAPPQFPLPSSSSKPPHSLWLARSTWPGRLNSGLRSLEMSPFMDNAANISPLQLGPQFSTGIHRRRFSPKRVAAPPMSEEQSLLSVLSSRSLTPLPSRSSSVVNYHEASSKRGRSSPLKSSVCAAATGM